MRIAEVVLALSYDPNAFNSLKNDKPAIRHLIAKSEYIWKYRHDIHHYPLKENLSGYYKRVVMSDYRLIYTYDEETDDIIICFGGHRRDIYNIASKRL